MKLVHWPLMGELLHLVQRGGAWRAVAQPSLLLPVPNVTAHPSTASVPITVLLYNGPLLCGLNVPIKGLITVTRLLHKPAHIMLRRCLLRWHNAVWSSHLIYRSSYVSLCEVTLQTVYAICFCDNFISWVMKTIDHTAVNLVVMNLLFCCYFELMLYWAYRCKWTSALFRESITFVVVFCRAQLCYCAT